MIAIIAISFAKVVAAWLLMDLMTGLYHFATDRGWNFEHQVSQFREHHDTNSMLGFDWQPMTVGMPVMAIGFACESSFWLAMGAFAVLAQIPHYYAHIPNPPRFIKLLQRAGLMITPEHHAGHHSGAFDCNFCIFTGWADLVLNPIVKMFPASPPALTGGMSAERQGQEIAPPVAAAQGLRPHQGRGAAGC